MARKDGRCAPTAGSGAATAAAATRACCCRTPRLLMGGEWRARCAPTLEPAPHVRESKLHAGMDCAIASHQFLRGGRAAPRALAAWGEAFRTPACIGCLARMCVHVHAAHRLRTIFACLRQARLKLLQGRACHLLHGSGLHSRLCRAPKRNGRGEALGSGRQALSLCFRRRIAVAGADLRASLY